ncbi:MAG: MBL fold metallo-hydrolase [candidate division WOR-3 bacterium]
MKNIKTFLSKNFEVHYVKIGSFKLDGGAMFGIVPKTIWENFYPADEKNRILLSQNSLIVISKNFKLLIEPGCGNKWDNKRKEVFEFEGGIEDFSLFNLNEINYVSFTHLHFDHAGGATKIENGKIVPLFKNATYFIRKEEIEDALNPNERTKASYLKEDFFPLIENKKVIEIKEDGEILENIKIFKTGGHTRGHIIFLIDDKFLFFGDLVPTSKHIHLPYIMAYDNFPLETLEKRKEIYKYIVENRIQVFFPHDNELKTGYIKFENNRYFLDEIP